MESNYPPIALGRWLREELRNGLYPDASVEAYMASTFGATNLDTILANADSSEIDSLVDLLFYPDIAFQTRYEKKWGRMSFPADAPARVTAFLKQSAIAATLYFPGQAEPVSLPVPPETLDSLVQRLNITWQPPSRLDAQLDKSVPADQHAGVRVRLRNTLLGWTEVRTSLVCLYLEKMPAGDPDFLTGLDFLLNLLWAMEADALPFDFLISRKHALFQTLCKAEDFERRRNASAMEILMLQGERAAYGDMDQIKREMRLIDIICNALFGQTRFFAQPTRDSVSVDNRQREAIVDTVLKVLM